MKLAAGNAKAEIGDITDEASAKKMGWTPSPGDASSDAAAINERVRELGKAHPDQIVAAVKIGGNWTVITKPISKLQDNRGNTLTANSSADRAQTQRSQDRTARDAKRQQAAQDREAKRQARAAQRDADRAQRQQERSQRQSRRASQKSLELERKEAARKLNGIEGDMQSDFESEIADTYRAYAEDHDYDWSEHEGEVKQILSEYYPELFESAYDNAKSAHGLGVTWDVHNPEVVKVINQLIGDRVKGIADTTKQTLKDLVHVHTEAGLSPSQLAKLIVEQGITDSKSRAQTIARTESATAYRHGSLKAYTDGGVARVRALDSESDAECAGRHDKVYTIEEASAINPHPNCVLAWSPEVE
jgi:hypothetical protein